MQYAMYMKETTLNDDNFVIVLEICLYSVVKCQNQLWIDVYHCSTACIPIGLRFEKILHFLNKFLC